MTGVITAVIRKREGKNGGYGFILDDANIERFFHASNLRGVTFDNLREGSRVTFDPFEIPGKGMRAENVVVQSA